MIRRRRNVPDDTAPAPGTRQRRWALVGGVVLAALVAGVLAATDPFGASAPASNGVSDNRYPTSLKTVVRRPLSSETEQAGTLGYAASYSIGLPTGTSAAQLTADRTAVTTDSQRVAADEQAVTTARRLAGPTSASTLLAAETAVTNDEKALATAESQLAADQRLSCPGAASGAGANANPSSGTPTNSSTPSSSGSPSSGSPSSGAPTTTGSPGTGGTPTTTASAGPSTGGHSPNGSTTTTARRTPGAAAAALLTSDSFHAPSVTTGEGSATGATTASVTGTVDPNGGGTSYAFEYGTTSAFGQRTASVDAGAGTSPVSVSADLSGLRPDTSYDFALVATNAAGTVIGATGAFQTAGSSCAAGQAVVTSDRQALAQAKDALAADRVSSDSSVTQAQNSLLSDEEALSAAESALSTDEARATNPGATFTSLPTVGAVVHRGQALYSLDGRPVELFYGSVTPYRALYLGVSDGPDVLQLEKNLAALGDLPGTTPSPHFSPAVTAGVEAWQRAAGAPATGVVALGDVVYEPGPVQIDTVTPSTGSAATPGATVLSATSTIPQVTIALDASQQSEVHAGDKVSIVLPDNSTTPGVVTSVGSVATTPSSSNGGPSSPTVNVEVSPTDPAELGGLSQGSVNVWITTASVAEADVVPVDALLALASGGYALEVVSHGVHQLEGVQLGLFDDADGLVQVSGAAVHPGQRVVVPGL